MQEQKKIIETLYDKIAGNPYDVVMLENILEDIMVDYDHKAIEFNLNGKSYKLKLTNA